MRRVAWAARTTRVRFGRVLFAAAAWIVAWANCGETQEARWTQEASEMLPALARLANLEVKTQPVLRETDARGLRRYVEARIAETFPGDLLDRMDAAYVWLGLLPDTVDLRALFVEVYQEQVFGFYDPRDDIFYVRREAPEEAVTSVLAHELVHALQDQHVDLDSIIADTSDNDRNIAARAAIEGHATLVMFLWQMSQETGRAVAVEELPDLGELVEGSMAAARGSMPVLARAPRIIRESLIFPYSRGTAYVQNLWRDLPERPPPFGDYLPLSTEEVLHGEGLPPPVTIRWSAGPAGWERLYENDLGEFETRVLLDEHLNDATLAARVAAGWNGDRFSIWVGNGGRDTAFAWLTVWDTEEDAAEFEDAYRALATVRFGAVDGGRELEGPSGWARLDALPVSGRPAVRILEARRPIDPAFVDALRFVTRPVAP